MLLNLLFLAAEISAPGAMYHQPQLARGQGMVGLTFGHEGAVMFAASTDGGQTFGAPMVVSKDAAVKAMVGRHRGPRLVIAPKGLVISAIRGGELLAWRSMDRGKTWSAKGVSINDVPNAAREGLHAMTALPDGTIAAAWLDLRDNAMKLYASTSKDGGATWSKNVLAYSSPDGHICECCHPTLTSDAQGALHFMWRNWLGGSRDLYMTTSRDGGKTFERAHKLGDGTWPLQACPMDGGGLVVDDGGGVTTVWRRDKTVYLASPGRTERSVGEGKDPAIGAAGRGVWVAWTQNGSVMTWSATSLEAKAVGAGGFPVLLGSLLAYENAGKIVVRDLLKP